MIDYATKPKLKAAHEDYLDRAWPVWAKNITTAVGIAVAGSLLAALFAAYFTA